MLFTKEKISLFLVEIVIVVVGILIAFQVEEWRDRLGEEREVAAALGRLEEETRANLQICERGLPRVARNADAALLVLNAIGSGRLHEDDVDEFEWGLATVSLNPRPWFLATVAEEMISTGLLKNVDDEGLREKIALVVTRLDQINDIHPAWNDALNAAAAELNRTVEYRYTGSDNLEDLLDPADFENGIEVSYGFDDLAANHYLGNLLIEAADVHVDRYKNSRNICETLAGIAGLLPAARAD